MLVLSRLLGESLKMTIAAGAVIADGIEIDIKVVKVGQQIKIAIKAPDAVKILRKELSEK